VAVHEGRSRRSHHRACGARRPPLETDTGRPRGPLLQLVFAVRRLRWSATVYAATDERIITQRGIINKTYEDVPVTMISSVDLAQSIGKRALGYGTIVFSTQGQSGARKKGLVWEAVPDPFAVRRRIQEVMDVRSKPKE
jgi:uncharacterized membrane protein YdbT with pleckstrin-like domain